MLKRRSSKRDLSSGEVQHAIREAEKTAASVAAGASARVAETAGRAGHAAGRAGHAATAMTEKVGARAGHAEENLKQSRRTLARRIRRSQATVSRKPSVAAEALLRAQLAKTSRELSHESADLRETVDSLSAVVLSANRRATARGRRRLVLGLALGAMLMYHFDAEHGRERRAAATRRLRAVGLGGGAASG
jgi:hypothetical protein